MTTTCCFSDMKLKGAHTHVFRFFIAAQKSTTLKICGVTAAVVWLGCMVHLSYPSHHPVVRPLLSSLPPSIAITTPRQQNRNKICQGEFPNILTWREPPPQPVPPPNSRERSPFLPSLPQTKKTTAKPLNPFPATTGQRGHYWLLLPPPPPKVNFWRRKKRRRALLGGRGSRGDRPKGGGGKRGQPTTTTKKTFADLSSPQLAQDQNLGGGHCLLSLLPFYFTQ